MKLNYIIFVLIMIGYIQLNAQTRTITVVSVGNNKPISNVLIYHKENIIGETNNSGKITITLNLIDSLAFVKNEYVDVILAKNQIADKVTMAKNQSIVLNEITVTPMTAEKLLKQIGDFFEGKNDEGTIKTQSNYNLPANLQIYNKFLAGKDTLHYMNNRFAYQRGVFKINNQTKIIKNFENVIDKENIYQTYNWNGNQTNLYGFTSLAPLGIGYDSFSDFYHYQRNFAYKIVEDDNYYKLEFKQKKKVNSI